MLMSVSCLTCQQISCNTFWSGLRFVLESPLSFKGTDIVAYARPLRAPNFFLKKDSRIFDYTTSLSGFQELLTFSFFEGTAFKFIVTHVICARIHRLNFAYNNIYFCIPFAIQHQVGKCAIEKC